MSYKEFAKDVVVIASAQFMTAIMAFLLLPVVTKSLGVQNYGIWAQFSVTISLLTPTILLGLNMAMLRLLSAQTDKSELREGFYSVLIFVALVGLALFAAVAVSYQFIASAVFDDQGLSGLVLMLPLIVLFSALAQVSLYFFRVIQRVRAFAFFTVLKSGGELGIIFILLTWGLGLRGVLTGMLIADAVVMMATLGYVIYVVGFAVPRFRTLRANLKFGLPLTPFALLSWVINLSYPYFIGFFLGLAYVGSYSAAYSIGGTIYLLASPIQMALLPVISRLYDGHDLEGVRYHLSQSLRHFLLLSIPALAGLTVLSPVLLQTLTTPDFIAGSEVLPYIAFSGVLGGVATIVSNVLYLEKKPHLELYVHIASAIIVIVMNVALIPVLGILGAALASVVSYFGMVAITQYYSTRYLRFTMEWRSIIKSGVAAAVMSVVIVVMSPQDLVEIIVDIGIGALIYFGVLFAIGGINGQEISFLKEKVERVRAFLVRQG